jgi:hypothetical protein
MSSRTAFPAPSAHEVNHALCLQRNKSSRCNPAWPYVCGKRIITLLHRFEAQMTSSNHGTEPLRSRQLCIFLRILNVLRFRKVHCRCHKSALLFPRLGHMNRVHTILRYPLNYWISGLCPLCGILDTRKRFGRLRFSRRWLWRMPSSGILRRVTVVRTDVSEEPSVFIITVTRIGELGTLAVTSISSQRGSVARFLRNVGSYKSHAV